MENREIRKRGKEEQDELGDWDRHLYSVDAMYKIIKLRTYCTGISVH